MTPVTLSCSQSPSLISVRGVLGIDLIHHPTVDSISFYRKVRNLKYGPFGVGKGWRINERSRATNIRPWRLQQLLTAISNRRGFRWHPRVQRWPVMILIRELSVQGSGVGSGYLANKGLIHQDLYRPTSTLTGTRWAHLICIHAECCRRSGKRFCCFATG